MYYVFNHTNSDGSTENCIVKLTDGSGVQTFPQDPANADYQQYLEWLEEGNVAEEWNPEVPE